MEYVGYIASIAMGIILGLMGGGGSILTVPILVYLFALTPMLATSYSLFIVGITASIGSILYIRKKEIDFQASIAFAIPSVIGVNISRGILLPQIPAIVVQVDYFILTKEILIMMTFATLMVGASYSMIYNRKIHKPISARPALRAGLVGLQGLIVGMIAGLVGAGGGFLIIPALVFMAGLTMRIAVGTSLMIIAFQSLFGFAGDIFRGLAVDWSFLSIVITCAAIGIVAGSKLAHKIKEQKLKTAFGWFVLLMGLTILIEQLSHLKSI